ncbi:MAG: ABC transporter substrate-binding protein [Bauldia sp.]
MISGWRAAALAAAVALAAPGGSADAKTLVYCTEASPDGFDPAAGGGGRDASATTVYNRLVEFKPGTTEVTPGLAERWTISPDGLTYTFFLRRGVKFHAVPGFTPTREFNADDVIFTFARQQDRANPYFSYAGGQWPLFEGVGMPKLVQSWTRVDDTTVTMTLTRANVAMLANLAMDFASIMSKEYADQLLRQGRPVDLARVPVGTGPFRFVDYQKDAVARYRANADYWRGKPKVDDLVLAITPDATARWQRLKTGECHVMGYPNPADLPAMKADANMRVMELAGLNVGYLAFNTQQKPFDDVRVRRGLAMAVDKKSILAAVFQGAGNAANNPIPPTLWAHDRATAEDVYDPTAARALLAAAGVSGLQMKLWAMPVQRPYNPNARRMAEMIQADFAKVGVTAEIVTYEWTEYLRRSAPKDRDGAVLFGFTGDNGDPDNFLSVPLGCEGVGVTNRAQWCNDAFDALIKKAATVADQAERAKLYRDAQAIFRSEAPWVPIAHSTVSVVMSKRVSGYVMDPFDHHDFSGVDIAE